MQKHGVFPKLYGIAGVLSYLIYCCFFTNHEHYLRKYTINFEKALAAAQKEHELIDYPKNKNLTHAFSVFEPFLDESSEVIDMMTEYLRKF